MLYIKIHVNIYPNNDLFDLIGCLISQRSSPLHRTEVSWLHLLRDIIATHPISGDFSRPEKC